MTPDDLRLGIIHRPSGVPERTQRLGPYLLESLIEPDEEGAATFYRVRVEPHGRTAVSFHRIAEEFYYVLSGRGTAILNGRPYSLKAGDFLRLPPGTTHAFVTEDEPLEMLDIHVPGSRPNRDVYFIDTRPDGFSAEGG
ncbi:cupin domain-containing protein [Thermopirellula anaerolimosa]